MGSQAIDFQNDLAKFFIEKVSPPSIKLDNPKYKPYGAFEYKFPEDAKKRWTKPLGKNLCIFDLDSRAFAEPGQVFGDKIMTWDKANDIHGLSLGVLQHWLFGSSILYFPLFLPQPPTTPQTNAIHSQDARI